MSAHFAKLSVGCYVQNNCKNVSPKRLKMRQNPYLNLICTQHRFRYGFCNFSTLAPEGADFGMYFAPFRHWVFLVWSGSGASAVCPASIKVANMSLLDVEK